MKPLTPAQLQRRKPIWTALSELFLDTETSQFEIEQIAAVALASGYSVAQLNDIFIYEVRPVVGANLLAPAGVWDGFDQDWLHAEALKRAQKRSMWLRFWVWSGIGAKLMPYPAQWQEVLALVAKAHAVAER